LFIDVKVHHLTSSRLDHYPVFVETWQDISEKKDPQIFRYKIMWERVDTLATEIRKLWCSTVDIGNLNNIVHTVSKMKGALR
jgi:hypothetical protein